MGKCPGCGQWQTLIEEKVRNTGNSSFQNLTVTPISEVHCFKEERLSTGLAELDRVLGGGVLSGSLILVGGDPGIGKSTVLLQAAYGLNKYGPVVYASGEESLQQIRIRANRLNTLGENILLVAENNLTSIIEKVKEIKPVLLVIDSIQTMFLPELESAPGSVSQVREGANSLMQFAKSKNIPIALVGHVTKSGGIAGPRVLEHLVDTVLYFEGERHQNYRILRAVKNRFGSTNEIGVFEMRDSGLREVENPSEIFLTQRPLNASGSQVVASLEGTRPLLVELQALVCDSSFGNPRRLATGVEMNRLLLMLAVLEKRLGINLGSQDVYINIAGGVRVVEPAADLGLCIAIISSFRDVPSDPYTLALGEVGLTGEVRSISQVEKRIMEAYKLGFKKCVLPSRNGSGIKTEMELIPVENINQALEVLLGG